MRLVYACRYIAHPLAWWAYILLLLTLPVTLYALALRCWLGYQFARYTCGRSLVTKIRPDMDRLQQRCFAAESAIGRLFTNAWATLGRVRAY